VNHSMRSIFNSLLLGFGLLSGYAIADTVVLTNGDRLTGTLDSISGGRVLLVTEYAGAVPIAVDAIAELSSENSFSVRSGGAKREGQFAVVDGAQVITSERGTTPIELTSISRAGQSKLSLTALAPEWSSRADLSAVISKGNSETTAYNALVESAYKKDNVEHSVALLISDEEADDETTKDLLDLDYGYKRFISEKWFASGNAEYFEDALKDIDRRITLGAGVGYQFWDDSFSSFSTDLGVSAVYEDINGETETNPAIRWGLDYKRYLLQKKLEFFHGQSVLFIPDSDRGEVIQSSTGLRYALNDRIDATARADVNHETDPAPGADKTDVIYTLGVGIKF